MLRHRAATVRERTGARVPAWARSLTVDPLRMTKSQSFRKLERRRRPLRLLIAAYLLWPASVVIAAEPNRLDPPPLGLDAYMPVPEESPITPAKVALGRRLFFDRRLSRDSSMSCATCHDPRRAFTDGRAVSVGVFGRRGERSVPTLVNRGYGASFFWDGRIPTLEQQVLEPIRNPKELDMTVKEVAARLKRDRGYRKSFRLVFERDLNTEDLARALATYVRTIRSGNSAFDRYTNGDRNALSEQARLGLNLFRGKANCVACHVGPNLTDERFHNTGVAWRDGRLLDPGRFAITSKETDRGAFKTPTLREIARTAPYMHDGSLATLEDVIDYYDRGGNRNPYLDTELRPLRLTKQEKESLLVFLRALDGKKPQMNTEERR